MQTVTESLVSHSMVSMSLHKLFSGKSELKFLMLGVKIPSKMPGLQEVPCCWICLDGESFPNFCAWLVVSFHKFEHLLILLYLSKERDAITLLRANLHGKPLELIKGIGQDYDAAWEYLESIYGDLRFVADTITQDIARFKEDACFCDLVHLVRRSFNTLTEVTLRFREHEVAVTGDISKMYHRVLIPEQDRHVHRYLWRNMETH